MIKPNLPNNLSQNFTDYQFIVSRIYYVHYLFEKWNNICPSSVFLFLSILLDFSQNNSGCISAETILLILKDRNCQSIEIWTYLKRLSALSSLTYLGLNSTFLMLFLYFSFWKSFSFLEKAEAKYELSSLPSL